MVILKYGVHFRLDCKVSKIPELFFPRRKDKFILRLAETVDKIRKIFLKT